MLSRPADEVLRRLDALRSRGQIWLAHTGYRDLARELEKVADPAPAERALRLGAMRRELETAVEVGPAEERLVGFSGALSGWFAQSHWQRRHAEIVAHYCWLIRTELRVGRRTSALELFHRVRRLLTLDSQLQISLAGVAADLDLTDLGAARLYLEFLRGPDQDGAMRRKVLGLLRQAIRIDLVHPDALLLAEHRQLNDQLWEFREEPWCAAHRAVGAWRAGSADQAWEFRQAVTDLEEADVTTLTQLGMVAYWCRAWSDAAVLLERAEGTRRESPGIERLYSSLVRINQALAGQGEDVAEPPLHEWLERELQTLLAFSDEGPEALDARWVRGAVCALLGRDTEALEACAGAPVQHLAWRYAVLEMESANRSGQEESWLARVRQRMEQSAAAFPIGKLLQATHMLEEGELGAVRKLLGAVRIELPQDPVLDPDPGAVGELLRAELAFAGAEPVARRPELACEAERLSGAVRAWLARLQARWHVERGEFELAGELLRQPFHRSAPDRLRVREEAAWLALQTDGDETAGERFAQLGSGLVASPQDRLTWALWLCGCGEYGPAREVLAELETKLPGSLELRLSRAETELAAGDADLARQMLLTDGGRTALTELVNWTSPPRLSLFRPWQRQVPVCFWSRAGTVSSHRVGDMLHGARLMIRAPLVDEALAVIELVEQLAGEERQPLDAVIGALFHEAAFEEMQAGRLERACELRTRAAGCQVVDSDFAVRMAEALQTVTTPPADPILEVLCDWIAGQHELSVVEPSPVAVVLRRVLHIDATTPAAQLDLERRRDWTDRLWRAQPSWEWPCRNLAWAAHRAGRHEETLRLLDQVSRPTADEQFLRGRSAWELERFELAAAAFEAARAAGRDEPDARAWRACARTAMCFLRLRDDGQRVDQSELGELVPDLQWQACGAECADRVRAWHGAALLAAGRHFDASDVLDFAPEEPSLQSAVSVLRHAALVQAGQAERALAIPGSEDDPLGGDLRTQALRALVLCHVSGLHQQAQIGQAVRQLVRRNAAWEPFHLAAAHWALAEDRLAAAREALAQATAARELSILLAPLVPWLDAERRFLEARIQLRGGAAAEAQAAFGKLALVFPWPARVRYWQAVSALECGRRDEGERILADLVSGPDAVADARALWALCLVRDRRWEEAEPHWAQVVATAPGHPVALLARAEMHEARGDGEQAMAELRELTGNRTVGAGPRLLAAAFAALGRLEWEAGHLEAAEACLRKAVDLRADWPPAADRLALFLAVHAKDQLQRQEAAQLLDQRIAAAGDATVLHLAAAVVADGLGWREAAAEHLRRAVQQSGFAALPGEVRRQTLDWSANLHLELRQFGPAGHALATLGEEGSATGERMVQCWLLQGLQSLKTVPLRAPVLEEAWDAARRACEAAPDNPLAALLAALCGLLRDANDRETRGRVAELTRHTYSDPQQALLAAVIRHLAGDEAALGEIEAFLDQEGGGGIDRHLLALLVANQRCEPGLLAAEAEGLLPCSAPAADLPWNENDLVLVHALALVEGKQQREALSSLQSWHDAGHGTGQSRRVHSQLLAEKAVCAIRDRDLGTARRLVAEACRLLAGPQSASPREGGAAAGTASFQATLGGESGGAASSPACLSPGLEVS